MQYASECVALVNSWINVLSHLQTPFGLNEQPDGTQAENEYLPYWTKKNNQIQTVSMMTNYKSLTWNCKESLHVFFGWIWPVCSEDAGWHAHVSITWHWACAHESVNVSIDERAHCCTLRARSCARSRFSQWRTAKDNMSYEISEHNQFDMLLSMGNNKIVKEECLSSPTLTYNVSPGLQWFQLLPVKIVKKRLQVRKYQHNETSGWKINIFFETVIIWQDTLNTMKGKKAR